MSHITYDPAEHATYLDFILQLTKEIMGRKVTHVARNENADEGVSICFDHALRFEVGFSGCEGIMNLHYRDMGPNYAMGSAFSRLPKTYRELCFLEAPRVISSREHYDRVYSIITVMAGHEMTLDQSDYLETLSMMVENWEDQHCEIGKDGFYAGPSEEETHGEDKAEPGPSGAGEGQE